MSKIVKRTMDVFELFASELRPLSLSEVAKLMGIPVSSCHDVLQALEERGYLYQLGPRGGYYPTLRMHRFITRIAENDPILQRADMALRNLRDELDESVSLARIDGQSATYLLVLEPSHALRLMVQVGEKVRSLYATSAGKAVLGTLPAETRRKAIARLDMAPYTPQTISSREELEKDVAASAKRGWYLNREESVPGGVTVAATFVWNRSTFIVTVAGPTPRVGPRVEVIAEMLVGLCRSLENP